MAEQTGAGYHNVNPFILVEDATGLLAFLTEVLGGVETERITRQDGTIGHAEVLVGDAVVMLSQANETLEARPCAHYVFVDDVDAVYARALGGGASSLRAPSDQFYGNREACVIDECGNLWWLAEVIERVPSDELQQRYERSVQNN